MLCIAKITAQSVRAWLTDSKLHSRLNAAFVSFLPWTVWIYYVLGLSIDHDCVAERPRIVKSALAGNRQRLTKTIIAIAAT